jgi:hypothetical protein
MTQSRERIGRCNREAFLRDNNPRMRFLADTAGRSIITTVIRKYRMQALEICCVTGMVSPVTAPLLERLTVIDTDREMLDVLPSDAGQKNKFDLICCSMAQQQIEDTAACFSILSRLLSPDGTIATVDLEPVKGRFHDNPEENVHHGFERSSRSALFPQKTVYNTILIIRITNRDVKAAEYPVFLLTAFQTL